MSKLNKNNQLHVGLIEFYPYHSELIYSQLNFLKKSQCKITLFCDTKSEERFIKYKDYASVVSYDFKKVTSLFKLWKFLIGSNIKYLVFNTAQGNLMLKFSLFWLPRRIKMAGIIHNTKKFQTSIGQKIISRKIKNYYVLADYMYYFFPDIKGIRKEYVNCSYFPTIKNIKLSKPSSELWITIPGSIEYKRRDYEFLLKLAKNERLPKNVIFILLGNSSKFEGPQFIQKIIENKLQYRFKWFKGFVPNEQFYSYMLKTDFLLPLIHPSTPSVNDYLKFKVSGTFIQSTTFSIPMICHQIFNTSYFNFPSVFYETEEDIPDLLENKTFEISKPEFEIDRKKYFDFLLGI